MGKGLVSAPLGVLLKLFVSLAENHEFVDHPLDLFNMIIEFIIEPILVRLGLWTDQIQRGKHMVHWALCIGCVMHWDFNSP